MDKEDPCWKGYKAIGKKEKNGKKVPNCVKEEKKMKTLKSILQKPDYKARDHSKDAKKFAEKHTIKKTSDANGNDDNLFNAKNIKRVSRKDNHGYEPGEDASVYESTKASIAAYLDESEEYISEEDLEALTEEILDELSKKTLGKYINRAAQDVEDRSYWEGKDNSDNSNLPYKDYDKSGKQKRRLSGIKTATKKLTKEESEILDELSKKTLRSYVDKSTNDRTKRLGDDRKYYNRVQGADRAITSLNNKNRKLTKEDVIDSLIDRYAPENKATNEEKLLMKLEGYSSAHIEILQTLMETLSEANQLELISSLNSEDSINEMIDFAIENDLSEVSAYARKKGYGTNKEYHRGRDLDGSSYLEIPTGKYDAEKNDTGTTKKFGFDQDAKLISHSHSNERKAKRDINRVMKGKSPRGNTK